MVIARVALWKVILQFVATAAILAFMCYASIYAGIKWTPRYPISPAWRPVYEILTFGATALILAIFARLAWLLWASRGNGIWLDGDVLFFYSWSGGRIFQTMKLQDVTDVQPDYDFVGSYRGPTIKVHALSITAKNGMRYLIQTWPFSEARDVIVSRLRQALDPLTVIGESSYGQSKIALLRQARDPLPAIRESPYAHSQIGLWRMVARQMRMLRMLAAIAAIAFFAALFEMLISHIPFSFWASSAFVIVLLASVFFSKAPNFFPGGVQPFEPQLGDRIYRLGLGLMAYAAVWFICFGMVFARSAFADIGTILEWTAAILPAIILFLMGGAVVNATILSHRSP
jgi:hypothetical protein